MTNDLREKEAAVAAAYEDAARLVETFGIPRDQFEFHNGNPRPSLAKAIRSRADTDPLAARDAEVRAEAREEVAKARKDALREAAAICEPHDYEGVDNILCKAQCKRLILALIPADQEEEE